LAKIPQPSLFSWKEIDAASDLDRLSLVLDVLPDEELVSFLETHRGRGRDDYPIRPVWNAMLAGIIYQHKSSASLLRELRRNGQLRDLCGFDPQRGMASVPTEDAFGRFLDLIITHRKKVLDIYHRLVDELGRLLPDLGQRLAVDSKALSSAGKPVRDEEKQKEPDGRRELDADWGVKTYRGQRKDGSKWEKVIKWFGFKLHLLVDSTYELPLQFKLTKASVGDSPMLSELVDGHRMNHPETGVRAEEISGDKAYDSAENNASLYDEQQIVPIIDHRRMWKEEPDEPRPLFKDRPDVVLYDELGRLYCQSPCEGRGADERREMQYVGFEKDRMTQKWRCPAAYNGYECQGRKICDQFAPEGVGKYGRVIRVPLDRDRRIFTPVARPSPKWKKAYNRRTSVERVNSRIDCVLGFEEHFIRGQAKMETRVTLALMVLLAMALGRIRANQHHLMRSLTAPVRQVA
jgi:hypothetical protein